MNNMIRVTVYLALVSIILNLNAKTIKKKKNTLKDFQRKKNIE